MESNVEKMTIEVLEQEPTTKNIVDCVSRQFMFELGATCIATRNENGELIALGAIEELPSVTPQNIDYKAQYERLSQKAEIVISQLRADRDRLMSLPSVTPQETKKGHWIEHEWEKMREKGYYRCSVCNHGYQRYRKGIRKSDVPYIDGQEYTLWNCDNYCPNCGTDMREVEE